jgi:acyl-CoA thioesterase YciA
MAMAAVDVVLSELAAHYRVFKVSATPTSCGKSMMQSISEGTHREPAVRTVPLPADANPNGDIFGGWVLSQMDIAGGAIAGRRARGRVATVAIDAMTFKRPIAVGDVVSIYGEVVRIGRTSITVHLETIVERRFGETEIPVTEGTFVYVAIDDAGRPRPLDD